MPGLLRAGGKGRFPKLVVPLVNTLIADPDPLVREQMAKSIVCMAQELGTKEAAVHLIPPLIAVLNDSDGTVQRVVSERLGEVIPLVCPQTLPDSAAAEKVAAAVCKLIASIQGRHGCWRQERAACEGLGQAVGCFPPVCVQLTVLPALLGSLASSPRVAVAAGGALLAYLRDCRFEGVISCCMLTKHASVKIQGGTGGEYCTYAATQCTSTRHAVLAY